MKAVCWRGSKHVELEEVPDPRVINPRDAVVRVTATAICGSDLHLYNNFFPGMQNGDILGHEFMGEVVAVGSAVKKLKEGDRVVVPCTISCGGCVHCRRREFSACDNSNPKPSVSAKVLGHPATGMFGYSAMTGSYAGGQAQYVRVPFADIGPLKIPPGLEDDQVLFLSDILPTGWMGALNCKVQPGDVVAVWGAGPVSQMAIRSLFVLGAYRVIAIDRYPERLALAQAAGAETIDFEQVDDLHETLLSMTGGRGPDSCLDGVGMEAHGHGLLGVVDRVKQAAKIETDRPPVLREMIKSVRKAGTISLLGVYAGMVDTFPMGVAFNKGVSFNMGQVRVQAFHDMLLDLIAQDKLRPQEVISHRMPLDRAADGYRMFNDKTDGCVKVVLYPDLKVQAA